MAARAGKVAETVDAGSSLGDAVIPDEEPDGLIVLQAGSPLIRDADAYRASAVHERLGARAQPIFEQSLALLWGVLALLGQDTQSWLLPQERHGPFLRAMLRHADEISALDGRFTVGQTTGAALWDLPNNVRFVLARQGIDAAQLTDPQPPGGWPALVRLVIDTAST